MRASWLVLALALQLTAEVRAFTREAQERAESRITDEVELRRIEASLLHRRADLRGLRLFRDGRRGPGLPSGGPPLLVHVYATSCAPCMREFPRLAAMVEALQAEDRLRLVLVSEDDEDTLRSFLAHPKIPLPKADHYLSTDGHLRVSVQTTKQPLTLLLDQRRVIRQAFVGVLEPRRNELLVSLERLLGSLQAPLLAPIAPAREAAPRCSAAGDLPRSQPTWAREWRARRAEAVLLHQALDPAEILPLARGSTATRRSDGPHLVYLRPATCASCQDQERLLRQVLACLHLSGIDLSTSAPRGLHRMLHRPAGPPARAGLDLDGTAEPILLLLDDRLVVRQAFVGPLENRRNELVDGIERLWCELRPWCRAEPAAEAQTYRR